MDDREVEEVMLFEDKPTAKPCCQAKEGSESDVPKKEKDSLMYWSLFFIIALVVLFLAASRFYSGPPENPKITYNNWEFTEITGLWFFEWQKGGNLYQIGLRFNPLEVENIPIRGKLDTAKFNSQNYVYVTFDFSNASSQNMSILALASTELTQNIASAINRTPLAACVNSMDPSCEDREIKTCENTDEPVIYFEEGGSPGITLSDSCITLTGEGFDLLKSVDRLLYHWYGIIRQNQDG
jgi:hypothetical protein